MKKFLFILSLFVLPFTIISCGGDDEHEPDYPDQTLVVGSTYTIPGGTTGWTSENELIASISTTGVVAERVGETCIRNGNKSFKVTVTGKFNLYREPCMQWHASKATVKNFMSDYTLQSETDNALYYKGKLRELLTGYSFKNSGLELSSVALAAALVDAGEMVDFMLERYVYVTHDEDQYYYGFVTPDKKNVVLMQLQTVSSQVVYFISYAEFTSTSSAPAMIKKMAKEQPVKANPEFKATYRNLSDKMSEIRSDYNIVK